MADQLSDVFDLVEVQGLITGGFEVRGPWVSRARDLDALTLLAVVRGRARLSTDGLPAPVTLVSGDVAILNNRSWLHLTGGSGRGLPREVSAPHTGPYIPFSGPDDDSAGGHDADQADVIIGGRVALNRTGRELLEQALPPVGHVRGAAATATHLRCSLDRLFQEATTGQLGSAFAMRQYGQLLLLDALRAYVDQTELPPGQLRVLTDERLRGALRLLHDSPGRRWTVQELARAAGMSRTSFAERFRTVAGVPPLTYLNAWRVLLAQRALRDEGARVGPLAFELGYASESAFSAAFKRQTGESPAHYRSRVRSGATHGHAAAGGTAVAGTSAEGTGVG